MRKARSTRSTTGRSGPCAFQKCDLERSEGLLLRQVDSSLLEEWEKMSDPNYQPLGSGDM